MPVTEPPGELKLTHRSIKSVWLFGILWLLIFALYYPAAKGGWVSDTPEWLQRIKSDNFWDYINSRQSRGSLYQFTQFTTYIIYWLFGTRPWPWHLIFITLQATNGMLLFVVFKQLFADSGIKKGDAVAAGAVILFCIVPHISEVIVWKASYHYLQGMCMLLLVTRWVQKFQHDPKTRYAWGSVILFITATFSLESFYLIPWFALTLAVYYRLVLNYDTAIFRKTILYFVSPMCVIAGAHIILLHFAMGSISGNLGDEIHQPLIQYLRKPPLYIFHILFLGRFFSHDVRLHVYDFFITKTGLGLFYGALMVTWLYIIARFGRMTNKGKVNVLVFAWLLSGVAIACPLWFPDMQQVCFDRYAYFMLPFIYLLLVMAVSNIGNEKVAITVLILYALINARFTWRVNKYWWQSARIVNSLMRTFPPAGNKTVLLLNVPEYMNGVPMVGPFWHFSFRQMYNVFNTPPISNKMYDVVQYNMVSATDGAHVMVINDSMAHVTLNQWGTWWWLGMWGAASYQNEDFKLNMTDQGHRYELTLRHLAPGYLLLFQVGDQFKIVDWQKKNVDQY
jgi:hypothetical protein